MALRVASSSIVRNVIVRLCFVVVDPLSKIMRARDHGVFRVSDI
jgi:hypothetical protein